MRRPQFLHFLDEEDVASEEPLTISVEPDGQGLTIHIPVLRQKMVLDFHEGKVQAVFCDDYDNPYNTIVLGNYPTFDQTA